MPVIYGQDATPPDNFSTSGAGDFSQPNENASIAIRWVANEYISPETEKIDRNFISFESFDEVAGEDVRVEVWGLQNPLASVWVFVHDRTADKWWAYGNANNEGSGILVTHGVRFGEGAHQGRRFTIRAAILEEPPTQKLVDAADWQPKAIAISDPVYLTIEKRLVRPYPPTGSVRTPQIWLSTIDHQTVSATEPTVVPPSSGIAGTFEFPKISAESESINPKEEFIYVMIRSTAADRWRVFGPAVVNGVKWEIRDVSISDPGEPQWARFKISAVITNKRLTPGYLTHDDWWDEKVAASDPIAVSVKPLTANINRPYPQVDISFMQTLTDTMSVFTDEPLALDSIGTILQLGGRIQNIPQGASIWLLINPIGTPLWEVHGKAIVTPPRWELPLIHTSRLRLLDVHQYRVLAVVSTATLQPGLIDYEVWRMNTLSISEGLVVNEAARKRTHRPKLSLEIKQIAGAEAEYPFTMADLSLNQQVTGTADRTPENVHIWIGTRRSNTDEWQFSGPAFLNDEEWNIPNTHFPDLEKVQSGDTPGYYDVVAVATKGILPVKKLRADHLKWYALSTSPVVQVQTHYALALFSIFSFGGSSMLFLFVFFARAVWGDRVLFSRCIQRLWLFRRKF